ncbi:DUF397 domain-containing protein [Actinocorallia sp. A-T 12471]|uniref:DUF397 domain-containing protein n=1 Tax=Actinocorallia sp. A-T 12471 TaxID=3089813 RepID=UPI0029D3369E|nr:DUF397 domain-containing protein [Actinocorallia sp. A-T 12471]MDX6742873.1 DUF397 domain-containing protein [Actinocorallia sp. A-T 12471]
MAQLIWRKSSYSGSGDQCVEVAALSGGACAIRDSKNPHLPTVTLSPAGFTDLLRGLSE